jgi:hypothetical protein
MAKSVRVEEHSFARIAQVTRHIERANRGVTGGVETTDGGPNQVWHSFLNAYAGTIPAHSVVKVNDADAMLQTVGLRYQATRPSTTFRGPYAITGAEPVLQGGTGFLRFSGEVVGAYDTAGTPAINEGWGVKPDSFLLWKGYPSLVRAHKIVDSTNKLLLGTLGEIGTLLCLSTAALTAGTISSNYTIEQGNPSSHSDAGFTSLPTLYLGVDIDDDKLFYAHWVNNCWLAVPWECNA